jgi:hypothetical protein
MEQPSYRFVKSILRVNIFSAACLMLYALAIPSSVLAGRPLVIDDANPVLEKHVELELGLAHIRPHDGGREQRFPIIGVTYGLHERLELGVGIQRANDDGKESAPVKGFEDLHLTSKFKFLDEGAVMPALALSLDVKTPTANRRKGLGSGRWNESFLLIATKAIASVILHLNWGYALVDSPPRQHLKDIVSGGLALEWIIAERWVFVAEAFGSSREAKSEPNQADFQLGSRYLLTPQIVLDAAVGRSFRSSGADFQGTAGLTWTFDVHKLFSAHHDHPD